MGKVGITSLVLTSNKLKKDNFRLDMRKNFFTVRVVRCWNRLSREAVDAPTLAGFKARLGKVLSVRYPWLWQWVWGLDDLLKSPPTLNILWFCDLLKWTFASLLLSLPLGTEYSVCLCLEHRDFWPLTSLCGVFLEQSCFLFWLLTVFVLKNFNFHPVLQIWAGDRC